MRVVLLNPPGRRRFLRDYYCSTVSKAGYYWQPIDLLLQSGFLDPVADLALVDGVAEGLSPERAWQRLDRERPDVVLALVGAQSQDADVSFLQRVQSRGQFRLALSGEPFLGRARDAVRKTFPDAFVLDSFVSPHFAEWVAAGAPAGGVAAPSTPDSPGGAAAALRAHGVLHLPRPRHDLFRGRGYHVPFDGGRRVYSVLTAFGCPHRCAYCNSGRDALGFAERPLEEVFDELEHLKRLDEAPHLFLRDMDFTAHRKRALRLCRWLAERYPGVTFSCYARPDELDDELCEAMSGAGCTLLQLGVETLAPGTLGALQRSATDERVLRGLHSVRQHGLRWGAHVILGLPGEGRDQWSRTLERLITLDPEYVSLNLLQRRQHAALEDGRSAVGASGQRAAMERFRRRATLRFYLRRRFLARQLRRLGSLEETRTLLRDGLSLLYHALRREPPHGDDP